MFFINIIINALSLGILVGMNPCQLTITTSAITYLYNKAEKENNSGLSIGIKYALGKTITYTVMGWILQVVISQGLKVDGVSDILSKAEDVLPYILILIGAVLIVRVFHRHHHNDDCHNCGKTIKTRGHLGALALGMTLALAFCPETALMYFGWMIPTSATSEMGWLMPPLFALGAAIPVTIIAWFVITANKSIRKITRGFEYFQKIINIFFALLLWGIAIYMFAE